MRKGIRKRQSSNGMDGLLTAEVWKATRETKSSELLFLLPNGRLLPVDELRSPENENSESPFPLPLPLAFACK